MATRTTLTTEFAERATARLTCTLTEEDGVTGFQPTTLVLTLYDDRTGAIINSREALNVLNANIGTVSSEGAVALLFTPADMAVVGGVPYETHVALLEWTWSGGTKAGRHEIVFVVRNLAKVG
jgi:hypothetical protein